MKKVWSASIDLLRINVYPIGSSYGNLFDYRTYRLNEIAIYQNPDSPESTILKQKNSKDMDRIGEAADFFDKPRVIPTSLWADNIINCPKEDEYIFSAYGTKILKSKMW